MPTRSQVSGVESMPGFLVRWYLLSFLFSSLMDCWCCTYIASYILLLFAFISVNISCWIRGEEQECSGSVEEDLVFTADFCAASEDGGIPVFVPIALGLMWQANCHTLACDSYIMEKKHQVMGFTMQCACIEQGSSCHLCTCAVSAAAVPWLLLGHTWGTLCFLEEMLL